MNQIKPGGWSGRGTPVEDPAQIRQAMQDLFQQEIEFPIKVEGTHTLPYTARVQHIDVPKAMLHLKLIRPLPHELAPGAVFEMIFSLGDQRFEAPTIFHGRESYLLYRFTIPARMAPSDRRRHKRYPFRPREKAYVIAQDGGIPGHGLSGPLVNLSLGGLAFRVDRVMRLDDHMRVTPGLGFFERGKSFPLLKIRDLPNLPVFDARGVLANACERDGEFIIGVQFGELKDSELQEIQAVLTIRDLMQRASSVTLGDSPKDTGPRSSAVENKGPAARLSPAGLETPDALRRLGRRCTRLLLAMPPGPDREALRQTLCAAGFLRTEAVDTPAQALAEFQADKHSACPLLMLEARPQEGPTRADIQALLEGLGQARELPVALIVREGEVPATEDPLIRPMPWPSAETPNWLPLLDELAGLVD
ncbi:hypothetical protein GETHLI_24230 [Geothrix limicola]|uniref:PilZ domain-containing protein n=1 Tax=Geothrix limicola TaxID=2927978 RepID=A0ABQ5QHA5_9BACT|nr:PilZ domain-containing protein [Geothrix limicola]GLH73921.1 hypothetical protein GETHLI_24230 [Geothrix limicola]